MLGLRHRVPSGGEVRGDRSDRTSYWIPCAKSAAMDQQDCGPRAGAAVLRFDRFATGELFHRLAADQAHL